MATRKLKRTVIMASFYTLNSKWGSLANRPRIQNLVKYC